ncbi:MAG: glycoside hydrolase family 3 C-terminal domain-containing protein [Anaerolineaceae bacterium]|nr:glycoside hydrolase family 3 C-terminal domain-containing protein [Anaerolineaceae bacterium]
MPDLQTILASMTLAEKAALCTGAGPWATTALPRLGLPRLVVSDGPHGVRHPIDLNGMASESHPATCFPTASLLASTWDVDLIHTLGQALAEECIALGVDVLLGPGANLKRSPLGGRNFEYFSEDPYLAGEMAAAWIAGVQSRGVGASLKHFAANNQEFQRFSINVEVDERTLRELYLPAFETAVKKAQPWTVMCAYNQINGVYCAEHAGLLDEILKDEWGFEGLVVSDWGAVHDRVASLQAGLDLEMPGPQPRRVQAVIDAVQARTLDESVLDEAVRRILGVALKAAETPKGGAYDAEAHHELARQVAAEGMVLLKNDGVLPLRAPQRIAVIGLAAQEAYFQGGGSSHIHPTRVCVPYQELQARAPQAEWTYAPGYTAEQSFRPDLVAEAARAAAGAEVALLFAALPASKEAEGYDRPDLDLSGQLVDLIRAVAQAQPRTVVVLNNGAPIAMQAWIDAAAAVLEGWMMGQAGGAAVADLLFGRANPCGKLAETFPLKYADTPAYLNWPGEAGRVRYGEGLFAGYRYYDARQQAVQFPFGHGLSYTHFVYSHPAVSAAVFKDVDGLTVTVDVTNTGRLPGKEIVQLYVHDRQAGLARPPKELKAFAKVALAPGETRSVSLPLNFRAFAFYHPAYHRWITEPGEFDLLIGASAADIRCRLTVTLESTLCLPCILDETATLREWLADRHGQAVLAPLLDEIEARARQSFGVDARGGRSNGIGMEIMDMMQDMPLPSVLTFQQALLDAPVEDILADLLRQAHGQAA